MPNLSTSNNPQPRRTFRCPSVPFYLKAILLACASTAAYAILRGNNFREEVSSGINSDSVLPVDNTVTEAFSIKLSDLPIMLESTRFLHPTVSLFIASISNNIDSALLGVSSSSTLPESTEAEKQQSDQVSFSMQRHLLQTPAQVNNEPVIVANPVPDQIIQIGEKYTYDVSKVFSGDYFMIGASGLPNWLNLQYKQLVSYSLTNDGQAYSIVVSKNRVFVAAYWAGLQILDASNVMDIKLLGTHPLSVNNIAWEVAVSGDTAFVANDKAGLQILDISNPANPTLLNTYAAGQTFSVTISGNTAFMAIYKVGLKILDVSDLIRPKLLSTIKDKMEGGWKTVVSESTIFLAAYTAGLQIFDISNLTNPKLLSKYFPTEGNPFDLGISGNTTFVAMIRGGVEILDVSNLTNPRLLSTYPASSGDTMGIAMYGNIVFVAADTAGLQILDVSDLTDIKLLGSFWTDNNRVFGVTVFDNRVFVAAFTGGVKILDFQHALLTGIPLSSEVEIGQQFSITMIAKNLNGSKLLTDTFLLTGNNFPSLPTYALSDESILPDQSLLLPIQSEHLFTTSSPSFLRLSLHSINANSLPIWLSLNPNPSLSNTYFAGDGLFHSLVVSGDTLFLAADTAGLQIWDVSNLADLKLLSKYPSSNGRAYDVAISENVAFVANWNSGLQILDVGNLSNPRLLSVYQISGWTMGVAALKKIVFVAKGNQGLQIVDMSNFTYPKLLSTYPAGSGWTNRIAIRDNIVFVANRVELQVLNVSDLTAPKLLSTYPRNNGQVEGVEVSGNMVFIANLAELRILDASNLTHLQLLANCPASSGATGISIFGKRAFVALEIGGLQVLDLRTWQLSAYPTLRDMGNYYLDLTATDIIGSSVSISFIIRVEGPPRVNSPISPQYAEVGQLFSFNIPSDTFTDPNFDPLVFDLNSVNQPGLPIWLKFNAISVTLSGTPSAQDRGIVDLRFTAKDPRRESAYSDFTLRIINAPKAIPDQPLSLVQKRFFNRTVQLETIFDGYDQSFTYDIESDSKALLEWLNYTITDTVLMLSGIPTTTGTVTLSVLAQTSSNYSASTPFVLSINPNFPPQAKQAISAQTATVGILFDFVFPGNAFEDGNGDPLVYTASLAGGASLPNWLQFIQDKAGLWHFKGKPGGWDTDVFSARSMTIQIVAQDGQGTSATTFFNLNVSGTSTLGVLIKIVAPALSVLGLFRQRAPILNRLCYKRYQKFPHEIVAGQHFCLKLATPSSSVHSVEVKTRHIPPKGCVGVKDCQRFFKPPLNYIQLPFDPLPDGLALPTWMKYRKNTNTLEGTLPADVEYRELVVFVKNRSGIVQEQFVLKLEGTALDQTEVELTGIEEGVGGEYIALKG